MANDDTRPLDRPDDGECDRSEDRKQAGATQPKGRKEAAARTMNPERVRRIRQMILSYREAPCYDCDMDYPPEIMEFDHVRGEKSFTIANWQKVKVKDGMSLEDMIRHEIAKCEVRCPTCHRIRHFIEKQGLAETKPGGRRKGKKGGKGFINIPPKQSMQLRARAA